jgi:hypothetical protein
VGTEAAFHSIDEYMFHVADYFNKLDVKQKVEVRRVYLASDDPSVLPEAKKKFVTLFTLRIVFLSYVYIFFLLDTQTMNSLGMFP